jgi:plasmid stability protein
MATLYVESVPDDLYEVLVERAAREGKSVGTVVIELLQKLVPAKAKIERRREFFDRVSRLLPDHIPRQRR